MQIVHRGSSADYVGFVFPDMFLVFLSESVLLVTQLLIINKCLGSQMLNLMQDLHLQKLFLGAYLGFFCCLFVL